MISERTLRRWRKEVLLAQESIESVIQVEENWTEPVLNRYESIQLFEKILKLTQELCDCKRKFERLEDQLYNERQMKRYEMLLMKKK